MTRATLCCLCFVPTLAVGQMLDPSIDRPDEPFCYFSKPTDVIGVMDGKEGTLITPEGYLYTGSAELMFIAGDPPVPVRQRVKTLLQGFLPVIEYTYRQGSLRYGFQCLATTPDGDPSGPLVNFVRVIVRNNGSGAQQAWFSAAVRYDNEQNTDWGFGDHRFPRPATADVLGGYAQSGEPFTREWNYLFGKDHFLRDNRLVYLFRGSPVRMMTLSSGLNEPPNTGPQQVPGLPTTPVGVVQYHLMLGPGAADTLEFRMPYDPVPVGDPIVGWIRNASFDAQLRQTVSFWNSLFARGIEITVPETKVNEAFKANLVYDLLARNYQDGWYVQKVNEFQYDAFWLRDASDIIRMYDISGYHREARECLDFFSRWQKPDGNFLSQGGQFDGWGQAMWAYGQHFLITRDTAFARSVLPAVHRAVSWLWQATTADPFGLVPVTTPGDNENLSGHITGHNFCALGGLRSIAAMAQGIGRAEDAKNFTAVYDSLRNALLRRLAEVTPKNGGAIPPGLDTLGGNDWGNMLSVFPVKILDPFDPMVTATLEATRAKYAEGIMTYGAGRWLHHYLTMKNTETEVIRGTQRTALEEFYAVLLHTSATHAGFEYAILPWATRDFGMNLAPHGWFSAKFRTLLRDMMVREEGNELHLFSCLSPAWVHDGDSVVVRRAPTDFGIIDAVLRISKGRARISLRQDFQTPPAAVVVHIPWFMHVGRSLVDGVRQSPNGGTLRLDPSVRTVELVWDPVPGVPVLSFARAVEGYQREYRRRYDRFIHGVE